MWIYLKVFINILDINCFSKTTSNSNDIREGICLFRLGNLWRQEFHKEKETNMVKWYNRTSSFRDIT